MTGLAGEREPWGSTEVDLVVVDPLLMSQHCDSWLLLRQKTNFKLSHVSSAWP